MYVCMWSMCNICGISAAPGIEWLVNDKGKSHAIKNTYYLPF